VQLQGISPDWPYTVHSCAGLKPAIKKRRYCLYIITGINAKQVISVNFSNGSLILKYERSVKISALFHCHCIINTFVRWSNPRAAFQISWCITFLGHFSSWKEVEPKHVLSEKLACPLSCLVTKCWEWLASKQILQNASRHHVKIYLLNF